METDLDLTAPDFIADPYPRLAALRAQGPLIRHTPSGTWLATTHAAATETLRNRALGRIWTDHPPLGQMEPFNALHRHQMMENEPPVHTRLRRLVAGAFARGHIERMRPRVVDLAADMVAALGGTTDILADYAEPMPVYVIADLLGVPRVDHRLLRDWSQSIVHMYELGVGDDAKDKAVTASIDFDAYVRAVVEDRRKHPGVDLISDLIAARDGEGKLDDDELVASVVLLLNAGHEASVNAFGNGIHALLSEPIQARRAIAGEVPMLTALEELIRFDTPSQLFERTATKDIQVLGTKVAAGERIAVLLGSANRDREVFGDADRLDVGRDPNPHLGFGLGLHFCLGAPLARMELEISLRTLFDRFPRLRLAGHAPRRPTFVLRGFERIDIELESL